MAITELFREKAQPSVTINGSETQIQELWCLKSDTFLNPVQATNLIKQLSSDNEYGFPVLNQVNEFDSGVVSTNYVISQRDGSSYTVYDILITFSSNFLNINGSASPLEAFPQISFDIVDAEILVSVDQENQDVAIANSAGTPIVTTETEPWIRCTIVRNEEDYSAKQAMQFCGTLNESRVTIAGDSFDPKQCKLERWTGVMRYDSQGDLYWAVTYQILIRNDKFVRKFIDKGFVDKNGRTPASVKGFNSNEEYKLNGDGSFYSAEDQRNSEVFTELEFNTLRVTNWGPPTRLGDQPSENITILTGQTAGFGTDL